MRILWNRVNLLGKSDEVFVVGVHVRQLDVDQQQDLFFGFLFLAGYVPGYNSFCLFTKTGISCHLVKEKESINQ